MQRLTGAEQALEGTFEERRPELYWLAFLLTGHRERSVDAVTEALDFADGANPFFRNWMVAWARRLVIAKALLAIREELAASIRRPDWLTEAYALPPGSWSLAANTTKLRLEDALLAIDVFPRCALLLMVFERVWLEDAATLLNSDPDLVRKAKSIGLRALTHNLARKQGWTSAGANLNVLTGKMQPA